MIDLQKEFFDILYNDEMIGRWVLLRHYTDKHSKYWNPVTRENVGGPAYEYIDTFIRVASTTSLSLSKDQGIKPVEIGMFNDNLLLYYIEHDKYIKDNDNIYELEYNKIEKPSTIVYERNEVDISRGIVLVIDKYIVKRVVNKIGVNGITKFKMVFCEKI